MMSEPVNDIKKYRTFLETIPLDIYRLELKDIKWVEQDLPKAMLPLESIFRYYWFERRLLDFDTWFEYFWKELNTKSESKDALDQFKKYFFDKNDNGWFKKGFRARMYRTWVSVLTQFDFCYMLEHICSKEKKNLILECNAELDVRGIDARINNIGFQIKKINQRKEARRIETKKTIVTIPYAVFNLEEYERKCQSQRVKDKSGYKKALEAFKKYFVYLKNGFIVFQEYYLRQIIDNIDDVDELKNTVKNISSELSGES